MSNSDKIHDQFCKCVRLFLDASAPNGVRSCRDMLVVVTSFVKLCYQEKLLFGMSLSLLASECRISSRRKRVA
jgi:hypothetical protein